MKKRVNAELGKPGTDLFPYLTGFITASVIFSVLFAIVGHRIGFSLVFDRLRTLLPSGRAGYEKVLHLPEAVLDELTGIRAVVENADNPTGQPEHDTILVRPDEEIGYALMPNAEIFAYMLKSTKPFNIDPPVLYLDRPYSELSDSLKAYIANEARLKYFYSTEGNGFRTTVPFVTTDRQILVIGDSVAFGIGVDDECTAASFLQGMLGNQYKVVNASVGGYNGQQCFLRANRLSKDKRFEGLIYIACQNDFMQAKDWGEEADDVIKKIRSISDRFGNKVILILHSYMEYTLRDFFLEEEWDEDAIQKTTLLRSTLSASAKQAGFAYYDWTELVSDYMKEQKSLFSRFALYSDHCHLSPLGHRLMAGKLFAMVRDQWQAADGRTLESSNPES
jgi:lysophospholipase L1-like esterase